MSEIKITWKKSYIGRDQRQRRVIHALGLKRLSHTVVHQDTPTIRGMVNAVSHLLQVEAVPEAPTPAARRTGGSSPRSPRKAGS
jgi:large subunit ribosomal protein L30